MNSKTKNYIFFWSFIILLAISAVVYHSPSIQQYRHEAQGVILIFIGLIGLKLKVVFLRIPQLNELISKVINIFLILIGLIMIFISFLCEG